MFCLSHFIFIRNFWFESTFFRVLSLFVGFLCFFLVSLSFNFSEIYANNTLTPLQSSLMTSLDCSSFGLPGEWAKVPVEENSWGGVSGKDFCVMSYEAKAWLDKGGDKAVGVNEINPNGCEGEDGDSSCDGYHKDNWASENFLPASVEEGRPWREIDRNQASAACERLNDKFSENIKDSGLRFGLITNREWQHLAWSIELNGSNWSSGEVGKGCLMQGNTGRESTCSYDGENPEKGCSNNKARHTLLNGPDGEFVYHVGGNVREWVFYDTDSSQEKNGYMNKSRNRNYGPLGSYSCDNSNPEGCGLGYGWLNFSVGAVLRSGRWNNNVKAGVFATFLFVIPSASSHGGGFRCALSPSSLTEPSPPDTELDIEVISEIISNTSSFDLEAFWEAFSAEFQATLDESSRAFMIEHANEIELLYLSPSEMSDLLPGQ